MTGAKYIKDEGEEDREPGRGVNQMATVSFKILQRAHSSEDCQGFIHDRNALEVKQSKLKVRSGKFGCTKQFVDREACV